MSCEWPLSTCSATGAQSSCQTQGCQLELPLPLLVLLHRLRCCRYAAVALSRPHACSNRQPLYFSTISALRQLQPSGHLLQGHGPCTKELSSSQECSSCRILCGVAIGYGVRKRTEGAHRCTHRQTLSYMLMRSSGLDRLESCCTRHTVTLLFAALPEMLLVHPVSALCKTGATC